MRVAIAIVALILCVGASSQEAGDQKTVAKKSQKTEQPKPATSIDTSSLEKAIREAAKEASQKPDADVNKKLEIDRKLAEYTGQLAVYTKELSEYTSDLSRFTLLLVVATAVLGAIGGWQGYLALRSVRVAESALTDLERPHVFIWLDFDALPPGVVTLGGDNPQRNFPRSKHPIKYGFVNRGRSPALLTSIRVRLDYQLKNEMPDVIDPMIDTGDVLPAGIDLSGDRIYERTIEMAVSEFTREGNMFLTGFIRYEDIFEQRHITGFCAKFQNKRNRFVLRDGDDKRYNYRRNEGKKTPS